MESDELAYAKLLYRNGEMSEEEFKLINSYVKSRRKYNSEEDKIRDYYKNKFSDRINSATNLNELKIIKNELITMPISSSKTLLYRTILMKEDELTLKQY